jgi:hypothetical protein
MTNYTYKILPQGSSVINKSYYRKWRLYPNLFQNERPQSAKNAVIF